MSDIKYISKRTYYPFFKKIFVFIYAILLVVFASSMIPYLTILKYAYPQTFTLSLESIELLTALYFLTYYGLQIPTGLLVDKTSINIGILLSLVFYSSGFLLFSLANTFIGFALSKVLIGIGASFSYVLAIYIAKELFAQRFFTTFVGLIEIAFIVPMVILPLMIQHLAGMIIWQNITLLLSGFTALLLSLYFIFKLPKRTQANQKTDFAEKNMMLHIKHVVWDKHFWHLVLAMCFFYAHFTIYNEIYAPVYIQKTYHENYLQSVRLNDSVFLGYIIGCLSLGFIKYVMDIRRAFFLAAFFSTCLLGMITFAHSLLENSILIRFMIYALLGYFSSYVMLSFRLYPMITHKELTATANACILMAVFLFPLALMPTYLWMLNINQQIGSLFYFLCYLLATLLAAGWVFKTVGKFKTSFREEQNVRL